jgi:ATP:ADP antiporter, AAA family
VVEVRVDEAGALIAASVFFFFALASWFVVRPMRDAVAAASGATQLSWLFVGTLTLTLVMNPLFSALVVRFPPRRFIPFAYHAIVASLIVFWLLLRGTAAAEGSPTDVWIGRAFFVWTSMFTLFVTSLFWCFMADVFTSEQAKRLFGFIAVGGTLGSVAGSGAAAALAGSIGSANLLLVSCGLLELAVLTVVRFPATGRRSSGATTVTTLGEAPLQDDVVPIGGSMWAGLTRTVQSRYLIGIAAFLVLFTMGSTFLYFEQSAIVGAAYADRTSRTEALARIELAVQVLTAFTQVFLTGRLIRWFGLVAALAFLPVLSILGFGALGAAPTFAALAGFVILRRAGNFALTNPGMEVLFTVVPREDKYKAKSFIETFVYRGGDQAGAWLFGLLAAGGIGLAGSVSVAVGLSVVWLALALWLARRQSALARATGRRDTTADILDRRR